MIITRMKTNRITNPLGFNLATPRLSWVTEQTAARSQSAAQVQVATDADFNHVIYDTGRRADLDSLAVEVPAPLSPCTRYFWRATVWADNGESAQSPVAWFETSRLDLPWQAQWITPDWEDQDRHPLLRKRFSLPARPLSARAYVSGLGLYELEVNGQRVGREFFAPGYNAYDRWIQYQTYDVTGLLQSGENVLGAMLGNGWYKGRFGFEGQHGALYGDRFALLCELVVTCADGSRVVVGSDPSWKAQRAPVLASSIYDGETYDANCETAGWSTTGVDDSAWQPTRPIDIGFERLEPRRSLPVVIKEEIKPAAVLHTPAGETVLDMGQNMVGWLRFKVNAPAGSEILLQHGEVLQEDNFFNLNLRSAKAEYRYISDGRPAVAEPHFTFFGFRHVKVSGWPGEINPEDFTGCAVYSDLERTGDIQTTNPLVNRLFLNALWSQKDNFLDTPTDCPQRDERMGWTGDAQVFSGTANYNMDSAAFFSKYLYDMGREQETRGGMVPMVVPAVHMPGGGACAWGDAATVIPWNVYLHYGDKAILEQQLDSMKAWVDFIYNEDEKSGGRRLWTTGFHFGDWLALDGDDPKSPLGGTEEAFLASAYYCYSAGLVAKAAAALGRQDVAAKYGALAEEVRAAIRAEYYTPTGRVAIGTQTALVLSLFMDLVPPEHRARLQEMLRDRLRKDRFHLKTGFIGTPYLCRTLSENGSNDMAYRLLLNEDYPSWLYEVKMGATTIWERWNSLLPDGKVSDLTMNSFNHYAYGSVVEWIYRNVAGLQPVEAHPGFRRAALRPQPDGRLKQVKASVNTAAGLYESGWSINPGDGSLSFDFLVPFNCNAALRLPDVKPEAVTLNGAALAKSGLSAEAEGVDTRIELPAGRWSFHYQPGREYRIFLSTHSPIVDLLTQPQARAILEQALPQGAVGQLEFMGRAGSTSLRELRRAWMAQIPEEALDQLDQQLGQIQL